MAVHMSAPRAAAPSRSDHGPAAMLMYDDDHGSRVVMLVRVMQNGGNDSRMTEHKTGDVAGFAWMSGDLGYSLVGMAPAATLHPLADEVRRQISRV